MERGKLKFLNAVGGRDGRRLTIMYNAGGIRPTPDGFTYTYEYGTGFGYSYCGVGIVANRRYSGMSPEEIELVCAVENPVTPKDVYDTCLKNGMTPDRAARYSTCA